MEKINRRWYNKFIKKKEDVKMSVLNIDNTNFEAEVLNSPKKVLVDFWASWCGPCRMLAPELSALQKANKGKLKIYKINVDQERDLARAFGANALPTIYFIRKDKITYVQGYRTQAELQQIVDSFLLK